MQGGIKLLRRSKRLCYSYGLWFALKAEKALQKQEKNLFCGVAVSAGVILGVVVIVVCLGLVGLMMWSEWSQAPQAQPLAEAPAPLAVKSARKKVAPAKKKKPAAKKKK